MRKAIVFLLILCSHNLWAADPSLTGKYSHDFYGELSYLQLEQRKKEVKGKFHDERGAYDLVATMTGKKAVGAMDFMDTRKYVEIFYLGDVLHFVMMDFLADGTPDYSHPYEMEFHKNDNLIIPEKASHFALSDGSKVIKTGIVSAPYIGIEFALPDGLFAQNNGTEIILKGEEDPGFVLVFRHDHPTVEEMLAFLKKGYKDEELDFSIQGEPQKMDESVYTFDLTGTAEGNPAQGHGAITLNDNGHGAIILSVVENQEYSPKTREYPDIIASTLTYYEIEDHPLAVQWYLDMKGRSVKRAYKAGEIKQGEGQDNVKLTPWINLCEESKFQMIDPQPDGSKKLHKGRWEMAVHYGIPYLELFMPDGSQENYSVKALGGKLYLNNERWVVLEGFKCD